MAYVLNSNDVSRYVWISRNMNKNYIVAFLSKDEDIILEPLAKFNGDVMYFKSKGDARAYIERLYVNSGVDIEPMSNDDGLEVITVQ
tara:strand:- start:347 stop:607 length:261 start_codon:yes stop_codon:yes gene_type:complete